MFSTSQQGVVRILKGEDALVETNLGQLAHVFEEGVASTPRVVFDLEQTPLIDSAGLEWLLDANDRCMRHGGQLQLAAPSSLCREILRITGLADQFVLYDDVRSAVRSFSR